MPFINYFHLPCLVLLGFGVFPSRHYIVLKLYNTFNRLKSSRVAIMSGIELFVELGYKFFRKRHYILNYFVCKITSAISEGINNKIKRLKRMAYGYRDVKYFLLKIHQHVPLIPSHSSLS